MSRIQTERLSSGVGYTLSLAIGVQILTSSSSCVDVVDGCLVIGSLFAATHNFANLSGAHRVRFRCRPKKLEESAQRREQQPQRTW